MARYRSIAKRIWRDSSFRRLPIAEKLYVLQSITFNRTTEAFVQFQGPVFRVADSPKRRPDLSSGVWRKLRREVLVERGTRCTYCSADCKDDPTIDHVMPVAAGIDPYDKANLVVSCRPCNSRKGGREGWL